MVSIGKLEAFEGSSKEWASYVERFEQFLVANGIEEPKKIVATFLTVIGSKTYDLLKDIVAPTKPSELKFEEILAALNKHYDPKPLVIAERFNFHKRNQLPDESIAEYCAALRKHASTCEFGTFLDEALRDRLVCGMRDVATQRRLLAESKLTLTKALEIAQGMEAASKQAQQFKSESTEQPGESINFQSKNQREQKSPRQDPIRCWRCNGVNHRAVECRFKNEKCRKCDGYGHIARVCRNDGRKQERGKENEQKRNEGPTSRGPTKRRQYVRYVLENDETEEEDQEGGPFGMYKLQVENVDSRILVPLLLNGKSKVNFELDTGASVSVISEETWKNDLNEIKLQESDIKLTTYTGELLEVIGKVEVEVSYDKQSARVPLHVLKGNGPSLMGRNWLHVLG